MQDNVAIIIPAYNEGEVISRVIEAVSRKCSRIICVDDGSTDDTAAKISRTKAILVEHPINLGAGAATQTGIDYALQDLRVEYFITVDADGQHEIDDAIKMLDYLKKNKLDIVLGSRFLGQAENISSIKNIFLKAAAFFSFRTTGVPLTDPHIGIRVFNRKFAENLKLTMPDFAHASELVHRIGEGSYKYAEVPVSIAYSDYSKAKGQPMLNAINIIFDLMFHRISKK
jgi:glycosyltransferase involved in cell wall biosynthesis